MLLKRTFTLRNKNESNESNIKEKPTSKTTKKYKKEREKSHPKKLSNYIKTDINVKFIVKNKSALKEYEIFLNRFKKKEKQSFGSINQNYQYQNKMSVFKDNPKLIISSYKANFPEDSKNRNVRYHNNILGVDEGLITLPKINIENEQNYIIEKENIFKDDENMNKNNVENKNEDLSNIYQNTEIKINNNNNTMISNNENDNVNNIKNKNNLKYNRIKSVDNKKIKMSYLDRGEEIVRRLSKSKNKKEKDNDFKGSKTIDNSHNFKYEIRRLNKWDFNNLPKDKILETERISPNNKIENILSEIKRSQQMSWLTEIKHNKEQFKIICRNKHLKQYINKINDDQNAIYLQNIKVINKGFDFNVFKQKEYNTNFTNNIENKTKDKININNNSNYSEIKTDTYNEIIKEKMKLEENLSQEITICAEKLYKYKNKIEDEKKKKYKLNNTLFILKKKQDKINQDYDENIKRLDLLLQQLDNAIMLKNNENKTVNENKNNNVKYNEINNKINKINSKNTYSNMGNLNSKRLSIINSMDLIKIRTMRNNNKIKNKYANFNNNNNLNTIIENNNKNNNDDLTEIKDEELIIKNNLLSEKTNLDIKHKREILNVENEKKEIKNEINKINEKLNELSQELFISKNNLNEHIQSLSDYYYQILKKGIDVRRHGLSCVIIKLMELGAFIDYNHFPNFLDIRQINYLMKIGAKIYEVKELIKLFQLFKKKEKVIKDEYYDEDRNKEKKEKNDKLNEIKKKIKIE